MKATIESVLMTRKILVLDSKNLELFERSGGLKYKKTHEFNATSHLFFFKPKWWICLTKIKHSLLYPPNCQSIPTSPKIV